MAKNNQSGCEPQNSEKNYVPVVSKIYIKIFRI